MRTLALLPLLLAWTATPAPAQAPDLRDRFGTPSLEAARHLERAARLSDEKKHRAALEAATAAAKADPRCQAAHYLRGLNLRNLGKIDECMAAYRLALSDKVRRGRRVSALAAMNLGDTLFKLEEYDEARLWFSRAVLEDFDNSAGQRGLGYRNLAVTLRRQGKHLPAAVAMGLAARDKWRDATPKVLGEFIDRVGDDEELATLLSFPDKLPRIEARTPGRPTPVSVTDSPAEAIADLLPDPQGRYVVAIAPGAEHYYVLTTADKPAVTRVDAPGKVVSAALAGGHLYVLAGGPARIVKLDVTTGKSLERITLKGLPGGASSLAVLPGRGLAFVCAGGAVQGVHLKDGTVFKTDVPGQSLAADPRGRFLYSYVKPEPRVGSGWVLIDGRPVFVRRVGVDWQQTALFHSVVTPAGLLLAGVRDNAASNGWRLSVSPEGRWVALAGGGGFRPRAKDTPGSGYGVGVFASHDLGYVQGYYQTEAHPLGICFNAVTNQVAAVRNADARVYHLSDPRSGTTLAGKFAGPGAWSGNGRYLVLANAGGGLSVYENELTDKELARASSWWKEALATARPRPAGPASPGSFKPVGALRTFAVAAPARKDLAALLKKAAAEGKTDRPGRWAEYPGYCSDEGRKRAALEAARLAGVKGDYGIAIFKIRSALKAHPGLVPLEFYLAECLRQGDQAEEAEKLYVAVVRGDRGRTELTCLALNALAGLLAGERDLDALHCLAWSLSLDRANPDTLTRAMPLLKKHKFDSEAKALAPLAELAGAGGADLPKLPRPEGPGKKHSSAELYRKAVTSVVLIESGESSGSGVCVARADVVLTNAHVLDKPGTDVYVTPFAYKEKEVVRLPKVRAKVLFRSEEDDVAVLRLEKAPASLKPLPVAESDPGAGSKVYAVGHPGLGRRVLELSISEGLISSPRRKVGDRHYVQHSAAVNPGNSGGPLLDERGEVVGLVTLKARLEGVSFAVRVETLRKLFKGP